MMAVPIASNSSRDYFRTQEQVSAVGLRHYNSLAPSYYTPKGSYQQARVGLYSQMQQMQAYLPADPAPAKRGTAVISNCGFGGGESRPRSRMVSRRLTTPATKPDSPTPQ